jgi:hypothetical protein
MSFFSHFQVIIMTSVYHTDIITLIDVVGHPFEPLAPSPTFGHLVAERQHPTLHPKKCTERIPN